MEDWGKPKLASHNVTEVAAALEGVVEHMDPGELAAAEAAVKQAEAEKGIAGLLKAAVKIAGGAALKRLGL